MKLNNYEFEIKEQGSGETIIFVHGSVSDYRTWIKQVEEISKGYHTITYSRRYHWPNLRIGKRDDYSMGQHVGDLEELIKGSRSKQVTLIGHSYGAFICLQLALKSPELIKRMILSERPIITLYVSNKPKPFEILKLLFSKPKTAIALIRLGINGIEPATKEIKQGNIQKAVELFGSATLGQKVYNNLTESRLEQVHQNVIKAEFIGSGFPPLDVLEISKIQIPTLLLSGENSPKIFGLLLDRLMELLPNARQRKIRNASHISHEDNYLEYNKHVLSFLNDKV